MTHDSDRWDELDALLDRVLDGLHDATDLRRLNEILRADTEARRRFVSYLGLHGRLGSGEGLAADLAAGPGSGPMGGRRPASTASDGCPAGDDDVPAAGPPPIAVDFTVFAPRSRFPGQVAFCYATALLVSMLGVLAAWTWGLPNAAPHAGQSVGGPWMAVTARAATVSGTAGCQWADPAAALAAGAPISPGRRIVLTAGLLEIVYRHRGEVIFQGPVDYTVDSAGGGFLASGRVTVRLVKLRDSVTGKAAALKPEFTIRTPASRVTNLGAESGAELAQSTEFAVAVEGPVSRTCVFRGKVAVELFDGSGSLPAIPVAAGRSAVAERGGPARQGIISIDDTPGDYQQFAHRVLVPSDGEYREVAWLKAIGTGPQRKFVAVGSGKDIELPPVAPRDDDALGTAGGGGSNPGPPAVATYTCRLSFDLGPLSPHTAMLQLLYVARNRIAAVRLNGKPVPLRHPAGGGNGPQEIGQFNIRGGLGHEAFVRGVNTLDIDVDDVVAASEPPVLWIRQEVSAIWALGTTAPLRRPPAKRNTSV